MSTTLKATEERLRAVLKKHFLRLTKVLLTKQCLRKADELLSAQTAFLEFLEKEARRKTRSKTYLEACDSMIRGVAEAQLGTLRRLSPKHVATLDQLLEVMVAGLSGSKLPAIPPADFASLTKKLFVEQKQPGRKRMSRYEVAFIRRMRGETLTSIILDLDPHEFAADPAKTMQKYSKAINRQKKCVSHV